MYELDGFQLRHVLLLNSIHRLTMEVSVSFRIIVYFALIIASMNGCASTNEPKALYWGSMGKPTAAHFEVVSEYPKIWRGIIGYIDYDENGEQTLGFVIGTNIEEDFCDTTISRSVARFNGQPIRIFHACKHDDGESKLVFLPISPEGRSFVVNTFKNAKGDVVIEHHLDRYSLPATGFTKEWKKAGGNAL